MKGPPDLASLACKSILDLVNLARVHIVSEFSAGKTHLL